MNYREYEQEIFKGRRNVLFLRLRAQQHHHGLNTIGADRETESWLYQNLFVRMRGFRNVWTALGQARSPSRSTNTTVKFEIE